MTELRSTPLRRRWGATLGWGLLAVVALGYAGLAFSKEGLIAPVGVALALGLVFVGLVVTGSHTGTCFACGEELGAFLGSPVRCPWCGIYGEARGGAYRELPVEDVRSIPTFAHPVGSGLSFPPRCCGCDGPATRTEKVEQTLSTPGLLLDTLHRVSLEVPHCDACRGSAKLDTMDRCEPLFESVKPERVVVLLVRSYAFYLELRALNQELVSLLHPPRLGGG
ncbi:MAG: hypothetical protein AB7N76_36225 [Planctomycetota bacterium]